MVTFLSCLTGVETHGNYNLQISAFPVPSCIIHVADAAAIKVHLLYSYRIGYF